MSKLLFKEEQRFKNWWLWILLIGIGLIPVIGIYKQLIKGELFGDNPMSNLGLILFSMFVFAIIYLFYSIRLKTQITTEEIKMKFIPFASRKVKRTEIYSIEIVNYGFVGGWGIRYGSKYGTVYNIKGNKGLAIKLKNNKKFLIGTQRVEELQIAINEFYS